MKKINTPDKLDTLSPQAGNTNHTTDTLSTLFFYFAILIFIIGFNFTDSPPPSGWYQQFMPNLNGQSISDITFLDSLNGYAVTDIHFILKTTNGGDNWDIIYNDTTGNIFKRIIFINQTTGFVGGSIVANSLYYILKTTNAGTNWFYINAPFQSTYQADMNVLNIDTIWTVMNETLTGGVFLTTNGGANWTQQAAFGNNNPSHIYMFNSRLGFIDAGGLRRTSDGGNNWTPITGAGNFLDMYFADSMTGWKCNLGDMKKTTDGGFNWTNEIIPSGGNIFDGSVLKITKFSGDTIWSFGGSLIVGGSPPTRGILFRTSNGGNNWLFQLPDTSIHINKYFLGQFINSKKGWAYQLSATGIHTTNGGNDTFYTYIKNVSSNVPKEFELFPNFPNPFNTITHIKYQVMKSSHVNLIVYDVTGRVVATLVNQKQSTVNGTGIYEVAFDGTNYSSGIYFYSLIVDDKLIDTKKMILLK